MINLIFLCYAIYIAYQLYVDYKQIKMVKEAAEAMRQSQIQAIEMERQFFYEQFIRKRDKK